LGAGKETSALTESIGCADRGIHSEASFFRLVVIESQYAECVGWCDWAPPHRVAKKNREARLTKVSFTVTSVKTSARFERLTM
jgi:hypothetical protein